MNAEELAIDPVAAAHRLPGANHAGRRACDGNEVEARRGARRSRPDAFTAAAMAATTSCFQHPPRLSTYRSHGIHVRANVACGPDGTAAARCYLRRRRTDGRRASPRLRRGRWCAPSHWRALGTSALPSESPFIDLFDPSSPVRLSTNDTHRAARSAGYRGQAADRPC